MSNLSCLLYALFQVSLQIGVDCSVLILGSIALSFRKQSAMKYSQVVDYCIEYLDTSSQSSHLDRRLGAWGKLQHLAEEANLALAIDGQEPRLKLNENRRHLLLRKILESLRQWMERTDFHSMNGEQ